MRKTFSLFGVIFAALIALTACNKKETIIPIVETDPANEVTLGSGSTSQLVTIKTNMPKWFAKLDDEKQTWCTILPKDGKLQVTADYNRTESPRQTTITITAGEGATAATTQLTVNQEGTTGGKAKLLPRASYYEKYPSDASGTKTTVKSEVMPIYFFGWGADNDYKFTLNFPEDAAATNKRAILTYRMGGMNLGPNQWDYTVNVFVKTKNGEWFELTRTFTPYGGGGDNMTGPGFGPDWEKLFYMDVTEYLPMLQGATEFRIYCDGDWAGFDPNIKRRHTVTLTFDLYQGTPERNMIWAAKVYDSHPDNPCSTGYREWAYGCTNVSIEADATMGLRTFNVPANVKNIEMKVTITGHGHDQGKFPDRVGYSTRNAAEFDRNTYTVKVNGTAAPYPAIIFQPCGSNYSQYGTYQYDRANWCPGNPALVNYWQILDVPQGGGQMTLDLDLERFNSLYKTPKENDGVASYVVQVDLFGYDK